MGIIDGSPNGYPYEFTDSQTAIEQGFEIADLFETRSNAKETQVFDTGQGVHVSLYDDDPTTQGTRPPVRSSTPP